MPQLADLPAEILRLLCQFIDSEHVAYLFATHNALLCSKLLSPGTVPSVSSFGIRGPSSYFLRSHLHLRKLSLGDAHDEPDSVFATRFKINSSSLAPEAFFSRSLLHEVPGSRLLELRLSEESLERVKRADWALWKTSTFASLFPSLKLLQIISSHPSSNIRNLALCSLLNAFPASLETLILRGVANWPLIDSFPPSLTHLSISKTLAMTSYHGLESSVQLLKRLSDRLPAMSHLEVEFQNFIDAEADTEPALRPVPLQGGQAFQLQPPPGPPPSTPTVKTADLPTAPFFHKLHHLTIRAVTSISWDSLNTLWPLLPSLKSLHILNFLEPSNGVFSYPAHLESLMLASDKQMPLTLLSSIPHSVQSLKLLKLLFANERPTGPRPRRRAQPEAVETPTKWISAVPPTVTHMELRQTSEVDFSELWPTLDYLLIKPKGFRSLSLTAPLSCPKLTVMRCRMFSITPEMIEFLPSCLERLSLRVPIPWNQHEVKRLLDHLPYCTHLKLAPAAIFITDNPLEFFSEYPEPDLDNLQSFSFAPAIVNFFGRRFNHLQFPWTVHSVEPTNPSFRQAPIEAIPSTHIPGKLRFGPDLKSLTMAYHIPCPVIPFAEFARIVCNATNLESLSCFITIHGQFSYSTLQAMNKLTTLQLATEASMIDFKVLPRTLTDLRTRRIDLRLGSRHSGPYVVGHTRFGTSPPSVTRGAVTMTSENTPTFSEDRFVIDLPRGLTRLSIATAMIAPQNDEDWPPNLTDLRFASDGWTETQLLSLKRHLNKLTQVSIHGIVEYTGSLNCSTFAVSKIERLVLTLLRPFVIDSILISKSLEAMLPPTITTISLAEYVQDCDPYKIETTSTALNYASDRMDHIYPHRQISNRLTIALEKERPFRIRMDCNFSPQSLAFFENLTTLKIAMHDCSLAQLQALPRALTSLFIVASIMETQDLVAALPPALETFGFASSRLHYFHPKALHMLPPRLTALQAEKGTFLPIHLGLLPTRINDLVFDSNLLWIDTDLLILSKRLNSDGQLKRLKVFNALASGAILPSETTHLSSTSMIADNNAVLGPQCDIEWTRLASPLRLEHLANLTHLDLSQASMIDISTGLISIPESVTELHLRVSSFLPTRYLVSLLPKTLLRFHLYLFNISNPIDFDLLWIELPRFLEEFSIHAVCATYARRRQAALLHMVPIIIGDSQAVPDGGLSIAVPHLEGLPTSLQSLVLPHFALAHRCHEWSLPNLRFLKVLALGPLTPDQKSALVSSNLVLEIETPQHLFVEGGWKSDELKPPPGTFRFISSGASVAPNPSDHTTLTVSNSMMLGPP